MDETRSSHAWLTGTSGVLAGALAGIVMVVLTGTAFAHMVSQHEAQAFMEATHLPPLLTRRGEPVELRYDVYCGRSEAEIDEPCEAEGSVFVRPADAGTFEEIALREERGAARGRFVAVLPEAIAGSPAGFSYYAEFRNSEDAATVTLPAAGAAAVQRSLPVGRPIEVSLGAHDFDNERLADTRIADAAWGAGPTEVGLEQGRNLTPIGGSAFDVEGDGTVVVLDEANKRLLRWREGRAPKAVPIEINGTLADMSIAEDGTVYVLETTSGVNGSGPVLRTFGGDGTALHTSVIAERPSQVRIGPAGPVVLQSPSAQWMQATAGGGPVSTPEQTRSGRAGRPLPDGREIVLLRNGDEVRVALIGNGRVQRSWVVKSGTSLAEVQLAEPYGVGIVLVTRVYTNDRDEFVVLVLDRRGIAKRFSLESADWAETAPLSRFRLHGSSLYQLGSTPAGLFVDRFDLEVE